ncbi:MAG: hypothetical protein AAF198_07255 [Pseudomonadota bacterium]
MEPITLGFYALICGFLSLVAPSLGGLIPRFALGAGVGLGAAAVLPLIQGAMGY